MKLDDGSGYLLPQHLCEEKRFVLQYTFIITLTKKSLTFKIVQCYTKPTALYRCNYETLRMTSCYWGETVGVGSSRFKR